MPRHLLDEVLDRAEARKAAAAPRHDVSAMPLSKPPGAGEIMRSLASAIRERRFESVPHLLSLLGRTAPADAEAVYGAMLAAIPGSRDAAGAALCAAEGGRYASRPGAAAPHPSLFDAEGS